VAFLTDYRSGAIGRISLETPNSRALMTQANLVLPDNFTGNVTDNGSGENAAAPS
jgi:ribosome biogenesis GTPase A